ncbi:MAG: response regulator [Pseudodesulfovibrio sp.]|nr:MULTISPECIES: ATP-binding protein [Pseudodesulfovibrio]MBU4474342.1 response regulator [Pseudomonadota bacterium]MBU4515620.1 response regulator [Pseudomonadota bacterium]MBU4523437.1 response regulator [Pseudomonadota bacterium]MBU4560457.1 response regulator [Pseudomonadota bacterium]MBV1766633.1 response regulator [Pseudodesulfovibrio sp.]
MPTLSLNNLLQRNLMRWVLVPSLFFILLLGGYIAYEKTRDFELRNTILAQSLSKQITTHVTDAEAAIGNLATALERYDPFWYTTALANFLRSYPHVEGLAYLDPQGRVLSSSPAGSDLLTMQLFLERVTEIPAIISNPIRSPTSHNVVVYIGLRTPSGNVLVGELSMSAFQRHIEELLPPSGGRVILSDRYGNLVSHPDLHRVAIQDNIGNLDILHSVGNSGSNTALFGDDGTYYIGTVSRIPRLDWIILIAKPASEVFLPIITPIIILLSLILLAFFLFVNMLKYRLRETIISPFAAFTEFIEQTARGNYHHQRSNKQTFAELAIIEHKFDEMVMQMTQRESQIKESEERFRQLVESIHEFYWISELANGRIIYASPSYEAIWGRSRQSLHDNPETFFLAIKPEDRLSVIEAFSALRVEGIEVDEEFRITLPDGGERWIRAQAFPVRDERGGSVRQAGVAEDITERKATQQALMEAKHSAEAANQSKTEFLTNISHELRTPLNGILGMLQLTRETRLKPEQAEYIDTAISSSKVLLNVINDILNIAQIEAGRLTLLDAPFSTNEVLETIYRFFRHSTEAKGVELTMDMEPGFPKTLVGDEVRIRQILFNLLGNSVKFTDQGHISVHASILPVTPRPGRVTVLLVIKDTGIGIPSDKIDYVFESFTQVDGTYTRQYQGTGLGLGIVRSLVWSMNGTIAVDSETGMGTTIYVTLQLSLPKGDDQVDEPPRPVLRERTGLAILVVEDDRVNQLAISRMLEKMGHFPTCTPNGEKALEMLKGSIFDCVFMDIQMPVMDGMEATRMIRTAPSLAGVASIPIIALTAHAMPADREAFLKAGMNDYVAKPVSFEQLAEVLSRIIA